MTPFEILVADDDPIFRSLAESRLLRLDARILQAEDGAAAWQLVRDHAFSLAIIDLEMPGLDGLALVKCLRTHPRTRHIPIVMCTSRNDSYAMQEAIASGVSSFLTKPVNWSMFQSHISHLMHMSNAAEKAAATIASLQAEQVAERALIATMLREIPVQLDLIDAAIDTRQITASQSESRRALTGAAATIRTILNGASRS